MKKSLHYGGGFAVIAGVAGIAGSALFAAPAKADTIDAYLYADGSLIATWDGTANAGSLSVVSSNVTIGGASGTVNITSNGPNGGEGLPNLFATSTTDLQLTNIPAGTTLALYIADSGLTTPAAGFSSIFTINNVPAGALNATESTYVVAGTPTFASNGASGLGTPLGSFTGTAGTGATVGSSTSAPPANYTLTEEFSGLCTTTCNNEFQGQETLQATPLPAALPLFAGGLELLGLLGRRKKANAIAVA